jgi:thiamine pyrophosphate-dependent acetolactate synthase large subunit-like protein
MEEIVGESLAKRLVAWGVDTVFGLPGDGINGLMEGFRRVSDRLTFVLVHHEEAAAFMAFTEAFLRGQPHKAATVATLAKDKLNELFS